MHLRSLHLTGFKTFADSTALELPRGIIGIVGPNGSGKSNIADAIQWALGEQSLKSLRGSVLTDVIFAGSDGRRPLNMAEVTLVLDNVDAALGIDFTEVSVERRAFRSSESEFAINKARCRLRDVQELFLDTGIGRGAYSIIGQNEVDRALSASPEDRRALFEEAAGIARYRSRRNETLQKLDATQGNLNRVLDILSEVEGQLEPMEQQAQAAREYREASERLRELTVGLLALEHRRRAHEIGKLEHEVYVLTTDAERLNAAAAALEADETLLRSKLTRVEDALDEVRRELGQVLGQRASAQGDRRVREERAGALDADRQRLEEERRALADRLAELPMEREAFEAQAAELRIRLDELEGRRATLEAIGDAATEEFEGAAAASEARAASTAALAARKADLQRGLRAAEEAKAERLDRISEIEGELTALQARVRDVSATLAPLEGEDSAARRSITALQDALEEAQAELAERRADLEQIRQGENAREREIDALGSRLGTLRELHERFHGIARGAQTLLEAARAGEVQGILGAVADLVHVPQRYEAAIIAALGERAQYLITETRDHAEVALAYLAASPGGRATLLPLDAISGGIGGEPTPPGGRGVHGLAPGLCMFNQRCAPAMRHLLGRVVVVDDRETAGRVIAESRGAFAAATLSGECFLPGGEVTGGREDSRADDPLARANEMAELATRIEELTRERDAIAADRADTESQCAEAEGKIREGQRHLDGLRTDLGRIAADLARQRTAREALLVDQRRLEGERESALAWCAENERRTAELRAALEALLSGEAGQVANADADSATGELGELARRRDAAAAAVASSYLELAEARQRLESLADAAGRLTQEEEHASARQAMVGRELARIGEGAQDNQTVSGELDTRLAGLNGRADELQAKLDERNRERADLIAQTTETSDLVRQARRSVPELQAKLQDAEVRRARNETSLGTIVERLATEYEMTVEAAADQAGRIDNERMASSEARELRSRLRDLGDVNLGAIAEFDRLSQRSRFLSEQADDLTRARDNLREIIAEIDAATRDQFMSTFTAVAGKFQEVFSRLFVADEAAKESTGVAELILTDPENILETGVEINVQVPGKKMQNLLSLSGGERSLVAISLMFAMLQVKPPPFCVLDEIDAALDEANTFRFADLLRDMSGQTQFIVITHARGTMEACDVLYGVTMQEQGVSRCLSVTLSEAEDVAEGREPGSESAN